MSTRISEPGLLLTALILSSCKPSVNADTLAAGEASEERNRAMVLCAGVGQTALDRVCTLDRTSSDRGTILTLRQPDGGFRRLLVTRDGRGVIAADGAERAVVTIIGPDEIEVALGGARYRLPATVGAVARSTP